MLKHGIRHTGMPAFGATHSDEELWGLVAFVESLPETTPDEYRRVVAAATTDHGHDDGGDDAAGAADAGGHDHGAHEH